MDLGEPIRSVVPTVHGSVLQVLATAPGERFTARQLARLVAPRASWSGVRRALLELVTHGLVLREDHPPVALFSLNGDHVAVRAVCELARLREELIARARALVASWEPRAAAVTLFGSAARGDGGVGSDLDLLVLRPEDVTPDDERWGTQLADLVDNCRRWTGNEARVVEYDTREAREFVRDPSHVLVRAAEEGIHLGGIGSLREFIGPVAAGSGTRRAKMSQAE